VGDGGRDDLTRGRIVADAVDSLTKRKFFSANSLDLLGGGLEVVKDIAADVIHIEKKELHAISSV